MRPRPPPKSKEPTIYFLRAEGVGLIKIGFTSNPFPVRLQALRMGSPIPLTVLRTIPGTVAQEAGIHERFAILRSHGEWFRESPELLAFIETVESETLPFHQTRGERAYHLRCGGLTWREVGEHLGISDGDARKASAEFAKLRRLPKPPVRS